MHSRGETGAVYLPSTLLLQRFSCSIAYKHLALFLAWEDLATLAQTSRHSPSQDEPVLRSVHQLAHLAGAFAKEPTISGQPPMLLQTLSEWLQLIDVPAMYADVSTQKAITTWSLLVRWIRAGLQEPKHAYVYMCKYNSSKTQPILLWTHASHFLAPIQFNDAIARTMPICHIDEALQCNQTLTLVWSVLPALKHYANRMGKKTTTT